MLFCFDRISKEFENIMDFKDSNTLNKRSWVVKSEVLYWLNDNNIDYNIWFPIEYIKSSDYWGFSVIKINFLKSDQAVLFKLTWL